MPTTMDQIHLAILKDAADEANRRWVEVFDAEAPATYLKPGERFNPESRASRKRVWASGEVFRADPSRSEKGGLCLSVNEGLVHSMDQEQIMQMHQIGRSAIQWAIVKNKQHFVGLIVGEAREGRNYFSRFPTREGQYRLF